jgi:hypothetical protein
MFVEKSSTNILNGINNKTNKHEPTKNRPPLRRAAIKFVCLFFRFALEDEEKTQQAEVPPFNPLPALSGQEPFP